MTEPLTKQEAAWIKKLQKVLRECPSERLGFYVTGDPMVTIYDRTADGLVNELYASEGEFPQEVAKSDAWLGYVDFPTSVVSTIA